MLFRDRLPDKLSGMPDYRTLRGRTSRLERPDWDPLIDLVGVDIAPYFMWMGEIELLDDTRLHTFKHVATRRCVHIGEDGRLFTHRRPDLYTEIDVATALEFVFHEWDQLIPEADEKAAVALAELRGRVMT